MGGKTFKYHLKCDEDGCEYERNANSMDAVSSARSSFVRHAKKEHNKEITYQDAIKYLQKPAEKNAEKKVEKDDTPPESRKVVPVADKSGGGTTMTKKAKVKVEDEKELSDDDTLLVEAQTQRLTEDEKFLDSVANKVVEKLKPELATIQKFADVETRHTSFLAKEEENDAENELDEASEKEEKEED